MEKRYKGITNIVVLAVLMSLILTSCAEVDGFRKNTEFQQIVNAGGMSVSGSDSEVVADTVDSVTSEPSSDADEKAPDEETPQTTDGESADLAGAAGDNTESEGNEQSEDNAMGDMFAALAGLGNGGDYTQVDIDKLSQSLVDAAGEGSSFSADDWAGMLTAMSANVNGVTGADFIIPADSTVYSPAFAKQMIALTTGQGAKETADLFEARGMQVLTQGNYEKPLESAEHTSAYTLGTMMSEVNGVVRQVFVVNIRGTRGGEWYSNFDFAPSHENETLFAENFLMAAGDVYDGIEPYLKAAENPVILVCGHSRGAACANLLGSMLNRNYPVEDVYVYTSATPTTVRGEAAKEVHNNIFNIINPCDMIPMLPIAKWGYKRYGTDIILKADEVKAAKTLALVESVYGLAEDIESYYNVRYATDAPGRSETGLTCFEALQLIASTMVNTSERTGTGEGFEGMMTDFSAYGKSDLAPLFMLFTPSPESGNTLVEHMSARYLALIEK